MPIYVYRCEDCEEEFKVSHSMHEDHESCDLCDSSNIARKPMFSLNRKRHEKKQKVGDATNEFIESAKLDLRKQKQDLDGKR